RDGSLSRRRVRRLAKTSRVAVTQACTWPTTREKGAFGDVPVLDAVAVASDEGGRPGPAVHVVLIGVAAGWEPGHKTAGRSPAARRQHYGGCADRWRDPQASVAVDTDRARVAAPSGGGRVPGRASSARLRLVRPRDAELPAGRDHRGPDALAGVGVSRLDAGAGRPVAPALARPDRRFPPAGLRAMVHRWRRAAGADC